MDPITLAATFVLGAAAGAAVALLAVRPLQRERVEKAAAEIAQLREAFQSLSGEALRHNSEAFLQLARAELERANEASRTDLRERETAIEALVAPIRTGLLAYDQKLQDIEKTRAETFGAITQRLDSVAASSESCCPHSHAACR